MSIQKKACNTDNEHSKLMKIINFRLPQQFKKVGLLGALALFIFMTIFKFYGSDDILVKDIFRTLILLSLLMASLSKDLIEDEYIQHTRAQSYTLAFICATAYSIGLPLISFVMDALITKIRNENTINFHEVSAFEVMFMLIGFQLLFFESLKRMGRA